MSRRQDKGKRPNTIPSRLKPSSSKPQAVVNKEAVSQIPDAVSSPSIISPPEEKGSTRKLGFLKFSPEVNAAIVGGFFGIFGIILGMTISNYNIIDLVLRPLRIQMYTATADDRLSGSGYLNSSDFSSFEQKTHDIGVGDVFINSTDLITEQQSLFFVTFHLAEMPESSEIEEIEIRIPCSVIGDPSSFSEFRVKTIPYSDYDPRNIDLFMWDGMPYSYYNIRWRDTKLAIEECVKNKSIVISGRDFTKAVQANLTVASSIQFMFWFSEKSINHNGKSDEILVDDLPYINIKYLPK